jgi:SAM-dependent methyltransferase
MAALIGRAGEGVTVVDLLDCYYRQSSRSNVDAYEYVAFRFGQPRYLVALSFLSLVHRPPRPILDLCCGFGHITRGWVHRSHTQPVIGLDHNFFGLYVAKTCIALEADYICVEAYDPLPFADRTFSAVSCVDGFHAVPMAHSASLEDLANEPTLSVIASHRWEGFHDHDVFADWPHAEGQLQVNLLLVQSSQDGHGKVRLRRVFPSAFYEQDHPEYQDYLPAEVSVTPEALRDIRMGSAPPRWTA